MNRDGWELFLNVGRKIRRADPRWSEACLRSALRFAENQHGTMSPQAGLCLLELADCLERAGDMDEAASLTTRYRFVLSKLAFELGIETNRE